MECGVYLNGKVLEGNAEFVNWKLIGDILPASDSQLIEVGQVVIY